MFQSIFPRKCSPAELRTVIRRASIVIPTKYLTSRLFIELSTLTVLSSYLSGTMAVIMFMNVLLSLMKKNEMNEMENSAIPSFASMVAMELNRPVKMFMSRKFLRLSKIMDSMLKSGSIPGISPCRALFHSPKGPDIFSLKLLKSMLPSSEMICAARGVMTANIPIMHDMTAASVISAATVQGILNFPILIPDRNDISGLLMRDITNEMMI